MKISLETQESGNNRKAVSDGSNSLLAKFEGYLNCGQRTTLSALCDAYEDALTNDNETLAEGYANAAMEYLESMGLLAKMLTQK